MKNTLSVAVLFMLLATGFVAGSDKKSPEPFYRRYLVAGNPLDDRIRDQEKRVEADPKSADLRNDFGNLLAARRFPKEAREQYELAMKLDSHNFLAPYNLGLLYETMGSTGRAISAYEKSVDRNRGFPPSRFRLGRLYERRGAQGRAIEQYARALQIDPDMRDPHRNPLIIDSRLMDRVSLVNYPRDLAAAAMVSDAAYVDRVRRVPVDRSLSSGELQPQPAEAPMTTVAPAAGPTPVRVLPPSTRRPPVRPAPAPEVEVAEPQPVEPPPPLPTPDATGGRPLYIGGPRVAPGPLGPAGPGAGPGAPPTPVPTPQN